jgi:hypothetical protein
MTETLDRLTVLQRLADLDRRDPRRKVFGAGVHQYRLNPPLPVSVVEAFETRHGVTLPEDYRLFLTQIGDGGAGPYYGVLPFGKDDDDRDWEGGGLVGDPSKPFLHVTAWNLPVSFWGGEPYPPPGTAPGVEDGLWEAWDKVLEDRYWNPAIMNGAIPICHKGCALRQWLVIHGEQRGFVWNDHRVDNAGIAPVLSESGEPVTFTDWYLGWLDASLEKVGETTCSIVVAFWHRTWRRLFGPNGFEPGGTGSPPS